jgi:CRISPR-associated exonuclease Cas4
MVMLSSEGMFSEDDLLPLSGLQHLLFCERQWALIHIEQQWEENRLTQEGRLLHDRVHESGTEARPGIVVARGLRVQSLRLGLAGEADVVEFHHHRAADANTVRLDGREGWWKPFPVEYKRGRPKPDQWDEVQLCAQSLCLEEKFGVSIDGGALFYGMNRRRSHVPFDRQLRERTEWLATRMHELYSAKSTPKAILAPKCENCSLVQRCMPVLGKRQSSVASYLAGALRDIAPGAES